jgi:hypothetical protein
MFPSRISGLTRSFSQEANQKVAWNIFHQKSEKSAINGSWPPIFCEVSFYSLAAESSAFTA